MAKKAQKNDLLLFIAQEKEAREKKIAVCVSTISYYNDKMFRNGEPITEETDG